MPPAKRKPAPPPDEVTVYVVVPITVSDKRWRAVMRGKGVDMTGVVTAAHVGAYLRAAVLTAVEQLGVTATPKRRTVHLPKEES